MPAHSESGSNTPSDFASVVRARRSVRAYLPEPIPDAVLNACFDLAILAPTSHNLECWRMIDVREPTRLARLRQYCLGQSATSAPHMIVVVARPDLWRQGRDMMLSRIERQKAEPDQQDAYKTFLRKHPA